ncbi:nucleoside recognition domain-containing protein [Marinobacterium arenosum]|uniref:nucleoside recognition domain-containing protein n=1 Tax=Marinobacterium arenosum TaxID=2862496 RepID=UPI001C94A13D|nr:nucleoside recognition domain-containing protein [Marinobacterium arenosum]MBY4676278.1 nucleoside recognition family protein [Marinobacterium arenosum]
MEQIIGVILESGRSAVDMTLYILLPIMVVMLALMKLLDAKGVLAWVANQLEPLLKIFGLPGLGVFAIIKLLFVSFAAPVATFSLMDRNGTAQRQIAATLAMVLTMSQANVVFPMVAVGLDLPVIMLTSLVGGLFAASLTYYLLARQPAWQVDHSLNHEVKSASEPRTAMQVLSDGGQEGVKIVIGMLPMLILAICFVNTLRATEAIDLISAVLAPLLALIGLPESTVLPLVTKFIAGGTAFMGVTLELLNSGAMSAQELNRMAGFATNPLDLVGVAVLVAAGPRVAAIARVAVIGACAGMVLRGVLHLIIF